MPLFCTQMRYTPEALAKIISTKDDRSIVARKGIESAGGTYHGMFGMLGERFHIMLIADMPDLRSHMAVVMKVILGGSVADIKTITLYTGEDVVAAAEMAAGGSIEYKPV